MYILNNYINSSMKNNRIFEYSGSKNYSVIIYQIKKLVLTYHKMIDIYFYF